MDRTINWLAGIDPTTRVGAGMGFALLGIILFIVGLSHYRDWPAQQPVPTSHAPRWYRVRQRPAEALTARLRAERTLREARLAAGRNLAAVLYEVTDPVGRPLNLAPRVPLAISAEPEPVWLVDAFVDTQTLEPVT